MPDVFIFRLFGLVGLSVERADGGSLEIEVADTPAQQQLRQRYLEAKGEESTYNDPVRKFGLFVGGLKVPVTTLELRSIFEPYGDPSVSEVGANNRGYVFIDLRTTEARAVQACLELSAEEYFGNLLKVEFKDKKNQQHLVAATRQLVAKKLTEHRWKRQQNWKKVDQGEVVGGSEDDLEAEEGGEDAEGKRKEAKVRKYQLYVDGIREFMTNAQLAEIFAPYGRVGRLAILEGRFFTFVDLETTPAKAVAACLDISGREYYGNILRVQFSKRRGQERITQLAKAAAVERIKEANLQLESMAMAMEASGASGQPESSYFTRREHAEPDGAVCEQPGPVGRVELPEAVKALIMPPAATLDDDKILPR